jgi:hypothetical protein
MDLGRDSMGPMLQEENRETGILGRPLSPEVLREVGALKEFPPPPAGFRPTGDWTQSYRILGCHGYSDKGNDTLGALRIQRIASTPFQLKIRQRILHSNGQETLEVAMTCRANAIASPVAWTLTRRLFDAEGNEAAGLQTTQERTNAAPSVTSEFNLMEAVQRLPFADPQAAPFDVLERMSILRPGHRLFFDGERRFHHTGRGLLPYQYWLDESHRLLVVVTAWRAYILDDDAESAFGQPRGRAGRKKGKK